MNSSAMPLRHQATSPEKVFVSVDGAEYFFQAKGWRHTTSLYAPALGTELKAQAVAMEFAIASEVSQELCDALFENARRLGQIDRALEFCEHLMSRFPDAEKYRSSLCSLLRSKRLPRDAVRRTADWIPNADPALLTSHAAALCDLDRWLEAVPILKRAIAMRQGEADRESLAVVSRIKAENRALWHPKMPRTKP